MYALCAFGAVNTQGFVWRFFMHYIYICTFVHSNRCRLESDIGPTTTATGPQSADPSYAAQLQRVAWTNRQDKQTEQTDRTNRANRPAVQPACMHRPMQPTYANLCQHVQNNAALALGSVLTSLLDMHMNRVCLATALCPFICRAKTKSRFRLTLQ